MIEIASIKDKLIDELWLPIAMKGGSTFYPRLIKNKKMKMLTLTHHNNCHELEKFIKNKLTKKELITGWNRETNEAIRLECERLESARGGYMYEDTIQDNQSGIQDEFPFDILNLDFSSQNPELEEGRIEKEILGIEHTIKIQSAKGNKGMVLIYTTILKSKPLNPPIIKRRSDDIRIQGWKGLSINGLPSNITDCNEKIRCTDKIFQQICFKYQYENVGNVESLCVGLSNSPGYILSIAVLLRRS